MGKKSKNSKKNHTSRIITAGYLRCLECKFQEFALDAISCTHSEINTCFHEAPKTCKYYVHEEDHLIEKLHEYTPFREYT